MSPVDAALLPQTAVNVDLSALVHNLVQLRRSTASSAQIMAVVKANAYGHGAVTVAKTLIKNGVSFLCVARVSEAVELRDAGIDTPILLFRDVLPRQVAYMSSHNIRATVTSLETARIISD